MIEGFILGGFLGGFFILLVISITVLCIEDSVRNKRYRR